MHSARKVSSLFLNCGNNTVISEQEDYFDYLYCAADLVLLKGKKYNGQRNLISQFKRSVGTWSFEMIDSNSINQVEDFFYNTYLPFSKEGPFEQEENKKVVEVLDNFDTYGMVGGYLIADGKIVGFSVNEIVGDILYTRIEKADRRYKGAYQMLVNQAAITFAVDEVSFINREEIIDRKDAKRMDTSLAIISILAIFSAWIDGYDYIATWNDVLSQGTIHLLQRILFVIVLITAGYAITHLFGNKIGLFLRKRRERGRRRSKRNR